MRGPVLPLLLLAACSDPTEAGDRLAMDDCEVAGRQARCGTLAVPEDRDDPQSRTIDLAIAVVPARESPTADPLVLLAGGPGQGAIDAFGQMLSRFEALRNDRDIVLVDQRGTGDSHPLRCAKQDDLDLEEKLSTEVDTERLTKCRKDLDADPRLYTTTQAVADLEAVLDALGYAQANVLGGSYGTRMALAFARSHPDRVRTMVIDGVAPVDMALPLSFAADADRALTKLFEDCAADDACAKAFPEPRKELEETLAQLDDDARRVVVEHPRTGASVDVKLTRTMVTTAIRGILYIPDLAALLPLAISRARVGDYAPLLAQTLLLTEGMEDNLAEGMFMAVVCSEDVPFISDEDVARETKGTFIGSQIVDTMRESCALWSRADLPDGYREPVAVDVPTLVLSGDLDPVTPPRWGEHAAKSLSHARHVVVPGAGHGTLAVPCMSGVLADFLAGADPDALDVSCLDENVRPRFFVDFAGPSLAAR